MPDDDTSGFSVKEIVIGLSDDFKKFRQEDFVDFKDETGKSITALDTQMQGVNGRLKKIENGGSKHSLMPTSGMGLWKKLIPIIVGAILTGSGLGITVHRSVDNGDDSTLTQLIEVLEKNARTSKKEAAGKQ